MGLVRFVLNLVHKKDFVYTNNVPRLKQLIACHSPWRPEFDPRAVGVTFVVNKAALAQVSVIVFRSFPVSIIPPIFCTCFHSSTTHAV